MRLARRPKVPAFLAAIACALVASGCSIGTAEPATYVTDISATLNGVVYSNEQPGEITYWFEWGPSQDYGNVTPDRTYEIPAEAADEVPYPVSEPIRGLEPSTTYHFRLCTSPGAEPGSRGCTEVDRTFTTGPDGAGRSGIAFDALRNGYDLWITNPDGTGEASVFASPDYDQDPSWSPDATRLAFERHDFIQNTQEIWSVGADGSDPVNLTNHPGADYDPAWSPRGDKIAFSSNREGGPYTLWVMDADGSDPVRVTEPASSDAGAASWSPDGKRLVYALGTAGRVCYVDAGGGDSTCLDSVGRFDPAWSPDGRRIAFTQDYNDIFTMRLDGSDVQRVTDEPYLVREPTWSPDGTQIALWMARTTTSEPVYVVDVDGGTPVQVSSGGGGGDRAPAWSPRP